jgi:hypothetical protein
MAAPSTKVIVHNPQSITDHQIDTENQIDVFRDHNMALSLDPFCLRSFEGRCQRHIAINLKLPGQVKIERAVGKPSLGGSFAILQS